MKKIKLKHILFVLLFILVLAFGFLFTFLRNSLPQTKGTIKVEQLIDEVKVTRNNHGIPTIEAKNDDDLYFAQGYIQAQDRLFQMDLSRRQASGRLAEVIGESAVQSDKKFLVFNLRKAAEKSIEAYDEESLNVLQKFADGVNAYIEYAIENNKLPYEFTLLGYKPSKWEIVDSLVIGKYMAYDLGGHYDFQIFNNWVLNNLGEEVFRDMNSLSISKDKDIDQIVELNKNNSAIIDKKLTQIERPPVDNGSNNWVISGDKSATGKPILSDDPHLGLGTPSVWYQMQLISPNVKVSGVIFAGIPGIILGNNEDIAWGVTNYGPDVQDVYIEKVNPSNPNQFEYDGEYYDARVEIVEIKVKGKESIPFEIVYSKNGPIIDELVKSTDQNLKYSMRWTAHEATTELKSILSINKAKNFTEFETALNDFLAPAQNFVYADKEGNIGFKSNGNIPLRKKGTGILPVPGYDSSYSWSGYVPFDKLPREYNPEKGYLATANIETDNKLDYHTSHVWAQPYRMNRIDEYLSQDKKFTAEDMKSLQNDTLNLSAREFLDDILSVADTSQIDEKILESLKIWDLKDDKNALAPLIFNKWLENIQVNIFENIIEEDVVEFMPYKDHYGNHLLRKVFNDENSETIQKSGGIQKIVMDSYKETIEQIESVQGKNISNWKWGTEHRLSLQHPLSKAVKALSPILNPKEQDVNGSRYTVLAAREKNGKVTHGASWRFVYDFSENTGYHVVAPGQAGHFMSPYYQSQVDNWGNGNYSPINLNEIEGEDVLILTK